MTETSIDRESEGQNRAIAAHPIANAVDAFVHRIRDSKLAAKLHLPLSQKMARSSLQKIVTDIGAVGDLESNDSLEKQRSWVRLVDALTKFRRISASDVPGAIERGLFVALFAIYDALLGDLLQALFSQRPKLYASIDKSVSFSDVLSADSLDDVKQVVLQSEIESLRRKSYVEQFVELEHRFGLPLRKFDAWGDFIEAGQRRNLVAHCDGIVSEQYLKVCAGVGIPSSALPKLGDRIGLGAEYFFKVCETLIEVGLKLGQTLWRKAVPDEIEHADRHLIDLQYSTLEARNWQRARMMGLYAVSLPAVQSDRYKRMFLINCVQAMKRCGDEVGAKSMLLKMDWSATSREFVLSDLVLREQWDAASKMMISVGRDDEHLTPLNYARWPLFIEFRETTQFAESFKKVFGFEFSAMLRKEAANATEQAGLAIKMQHSAEGVGQGDT